MLIFIDESGNFIVPNRPNRVSAVVALVIPETFARKLFTRFRKLVKTWNLPDGEVKGRSLNEDQMAQALKLFRKFDVIAFACAVDMGLHNEAGITAHKETQAQKIRNATLRDCPSQLCAEFLELAQRTQNIPNQLFSQLTIFNELVHRVIGNASMYYSQRIPKTLGRFKWIIDAKENGVPTPYESLWQDIVMPSLQFKSLKDPFNQLDEGDYSAFKRFFREANEPPQHILQHVDWEPGENFLSIDIKGILNEDLIFGDSARFTGLQMVDIIASAITRACNNTLQEQGWKDVGRLILKGRSQYSVSMHSLHSLDPRASYPYQEILKTINANSKRMFPRR